MQIQFERSGGFAGMRFAATIDTDSLSAEQAEELRKLVNEAQFFELPGSLTSPSPAADQFQYKLTVEDEGRRHTVETTDGAAPGSLRPLLRRLTVLSRTSRNS